MNVVSLFSGCGGSSLGYKNAGFNVLAALEFIPSAAECYKENHKDTVMVQKDIRDVSGVDIVGAIGGQVVDIVDGSPPCASFSVVGKRDKLWGKVKEYSETKQRVDDLFFEFIRLASDLKPKFIIAENVKGLTQGKAKAVLYEILECYRSAGYKPFYKVLSACDFGAPQLRPRVYIVAVREDLTINGDFVFPSPTHSESEYISVEKALENVEVCEEEINTLLAAGLKYANMQKWDEIDGVGKWHPTRFNVGKNRWKKPSYTITYTDSKLGAAGLCHPFEKRRHTVSEMKRLMGFPDNYVLTGTWQQKVERLGRSVCPQVITAIAKEVEAYYNAYEQTCKEINNDRF